jgi:hypothetical protein
MEAWQPSMVIPSGGKFSKGTQPEILLTDLQLSHSELCLLIYLKIISFFQFRFIFSLTEREQMTICSPPPNQIAQIEHVLI